MINLHLHEVQTHDVFPESRVYNCDYCLVEISGDVLDDPNWISQATNHNNYFKTQSRFPRLIYSDQVTDSVNRYQREILEHFSTHDQFVYHHNRLTVDSNLIMNSQIHHDSSGFEMAPHIDNSTVVVQMIVNIFQDNTETTRMYSPYSRTPYFEVPLQKNQGVVFVNSPGSLHAAGPVTSDRYTLYSHIAYSI